MKKILIAIKNNLVANDVLNNQNSIYSAPEIETSHYKMNEQLITKNTSIDSK